MAIFGTVAPQAHAQAGTGVIRVAPTGTDGPTCGAAGAPCKTVKYAVDIAESGATIRLAAGSYTGTTNEVVHISPTSQKIVTIIGGYTTSDWENSDPTTNVSIIDGGNVRRGFTIGGSAVVNLQGLTIQNGKSTVAGGGIYCASGPTVTLTNVIIKNNQVRGNDGNMTAVAGGGAAFYRCNLTITDVLFDNNLAQGGAAGSNPRGAKALGGGLFATDNTPVSATNLTLTNNKAIAGSGGRGYSSSVFDRADALGGGGAIQFSTATINNLVATGNEITAGSGSQYGGFADGGGMFFEAATITINDSHFQGNKVTGGASSATGGEGEGGAIMAINKNTGDSRVTLNRVTMVNHTTTGGAATIAGRANGGALTLIGTQATATNVIIANNTANAGAGNERWGGGGGIYISRGTNLTLRHATLAQNSVLPTMLGSALIVLDGSVATANYSIFSDHTGTGFADGAIYALSGSDRITLNSTLFWNNTLNIDNNGGGVVTNNNPFSGNPAYVSPGSPNYNYHITGSSAAKDKATGSTTANDIDKDPRPFGAARDTGADEFVAPLSASGKVALPTNLLAADGPNHQVNYTLTVRNTSAVNVTGATLTDVLPSTGDAQVTLNLASGPTCSSGSTCSYTPGSKTISWAGDVAAGQSVTISYTVTVAFPTNYSSSRAIQNTANLQYQSGGESFSHNLTGTLFINAKTVFLPIIVK
ncbi:MAG: hypothetical protein Kow0031_08090 [Anaerolineae bacterium]